MRSFMNRNIKNESVQAKENWLRLATVPPAEAPCLHLHGNKIFLQTCNAESGLS